MPAQAGIQFLAKALGPRFRGDERLGGYFFNTRTGLPASHCRMSSTICV
jgi:hypothetical protein